MAYLDEAPPRGATLDIYVRKSKALKGHRQSESTKEQLEGTERDGQHYGFVTRNVFSDDGIGASRYSAVKVREGYEGMIKALREDPPQVLGMWEQSRSSRDAAVSIHLLDLLAEKKIYLLVRGKLKDPNDPEDRKSLIEGAAAAEYESAIIRERTLRAMAGSAAKGKAQGQTPYGYRRVYNEYREQVDQVPHPEQAPIVEEIVKRVLKGESSRAIARDLTDRGVVRPYGGTEWHATEIRDMCLNPAYRGLRKNKGNLIPAIWAKNKLITDAQFAELEVAFRERSEQRGGWGTNAKHLLTGIAWCQRCDKAMYKDKSRSKHSGSEAVRYAYHCSCGRQRDAAHLEAAVRDGVNALLADKRLLQAMLAGEESADISEMQERVDALESELASALSADVAAPVMDAQYRRLEPKIAEAKRDLQAATTAVAGLSDVAALGAERLPDDVGEARALMRKLRLRVLCKEAKRGRYFDYSSIDLVAVT